MRLSFDEERREFDRRMESNRTDATDVERKLRHEAEAAANEYNMKVSLFILLFTFLNSMKIGSCSNKFIS